MTNLPKHVEDKLKAMESFIHMSPDPEASGWRVYDAKQVEELIASLLAAERSAAFNAGWCGACSWAERDDLIADIGSPAFEKEKAEALCLNDNCKICGGPHHTLASQPRSRPSQNSRGRSVCYASLGIHCAWVISWAAQ